MGDDASTADATSDAPLEAAIDAGPDSAGSACNPILQNCADPNDKCTFMKVNGAYAAICVAPTDYAFTKGEGEVCNRTAPGDDDCAKGFACLPNGAAGAFACFKTCTADGDCSPPGQCIGITPFQPYFGVCEPSCALFGSDCDGGSCGGLYLDIATTYDVAVCHANGAATAGQGCAVIWDCAADLTCVAQKCVPDCDLAHPCPDGGACLSQGLPNDGGVCP